MYGVLSVLLIGLYSLSLCINRINADVCCAGVFVSQADTSLVLATYGEIASDFGQLENAGWLLSTYILAMCTAQPLVRFKAALGFVALYLHFFYLVWEAQRHFRSQIHAPDILRSICNWNYTLVRLNCA